jgi:Flp pilus assembly protein TadG
MRTDPSTPGKSRKSSAGHAIVELALTMPLLMMLLFGGGDFARAFYAAVTLTNAASAGALFGTRSVGAASDVAGITQAAQNDAQNLLGMSVAATKYCQCPDGSSIACSATSCAGGAKSLLYCSVTTQYSFRTMAPYPGVPAQLLIAKRVIMRAR